MIDNLESILRSFSDVRVLVVGDVILDRYWWGSVTRISPEAPVPIVQMQSKTLAAGGAANVAANIAGLGALPILVGAVGDDEEAVLMRQVLSDSGVSPANLVEIKNRPTTVKTRVIAHSQQIVRIDQEVKSDILENDQNFIVDSVRKLIEGVNVVVLSDYAKGFLTDNVIANIINFARSSGKLVLADPKGKNYAKYRGASLITPNRREAAEACGLEDDDVDLVNKAGNNLLTTYDLDSVLITLGEEGMALFESDQTPISFRATAKEVYDVTGAGDTVIATIATALGAGADLETAADLANFAAGRVVEQVGTTPVTSAELHKFISSREV